VWGYAIPLTLEEDDDDLLPYILCRRAAHRSWEQEKPT
jgi:hypothetical protein